MSNLFCDFINGNDSNNGSSFSLRKKNLNGFTPSAGDVIRLKKSPDPAGVGVNATFTDKSALVEAASAIVTPIVQDNTVWAGAGGIDSGNVITNNGATRIDISAVLGGAPRTIYGTLATSYNLAAFGSLSLWVKSNADIPANDLTIGFATSTGSTTPDETMTLTHKISANIPFPIVLSPLTFTLTAARRMFFTFASAAPTNFYIDYGMFLSNGITLNSLIGKNTGDPETWYAVRSIDATGGGAGKYIRIDCTPREAYNQKSGYKGTTETVPLYIRECLNIYDLSSTFQSFTYSGGSASNKILVSGGWDTSAMSSQTGETWINLINCEQDAFTIGGNGIDFEKIGVVKASAGFTVNADNFGGEVRGGHCYDTFLRVNGSSFKLNNQFGGHNGSGIGLYIAGSSTNRSYIGNIHKCNFNVAQGVYLNGRGLVVPGTMDIDYNAANIVQTNGLIAGDVIASSYAASTPAIYFNNTSLAEIRSLNIPALTTGNQALQISDGQVVVRNLTTPASSVITLTSITREVHHVFENVSNLGSVSGLGTSYLDPSISIQKLGGSVDSNTVYYEGGNVITDVSDRATASGHAWKTTITDAMRGSSYPVRFLFTALGVAAGETLTLKMQGKLSHSSNVAARIVIKGGSVAGVDSDVVQSVSATSWTEYTLSCTPSEDGVLEVWVETWTPNGTTSVSSHVQMIDLPTQS